MFYEVKTIDGVKTKVPLTNSSGVVAGGNPIGTIISTYKKIKPANYLYCDGSTFDPEIYPGLYLYLGTNVLPDYRECAMVGAEKNTTNVFDSTETDPSTSLPGTQSHDVYSEGEFKDDQLQGHEHRNMGAGSGGMSNHYAYTNNDSTYYPTSGIVSDGTNGTPRTGSTTHGKQKAVFYYIKAVDGVDITDEDAFLEEVKDFVEAGQSYSTTEQRTGGTWIDGKPIYRISVEDTSSISASASAISSSAYNILSTKNIEKVISACWNRPASGSYNSYYVPVEIEITSSSIKKKGMSSASGYTGSYLIIEYTKTTD